ncbi:hydroxypyruvate isomerase [Effusibacillus dendaii]|uniref:Hydroxypyruvate isomerase n=1 Tax=Effusibacillus dendaii TaxID=2743772 RepID=A0A7I8D5S0_9BACL|nr:hydroxypyruvate isomerase [Effusibacillus dendaii]BCJ85493.1 hydroxypyruvate isomerase [Effusibacillus dendaii]
MFTFSANLSTLFTEVPFLNRFAKAKQAGFACIEFQFPYEIEPELIKREMELHQLKLVLFNFPPGNWQKGDRGISICADRQQEFRDSVEEAIRYAKTLNCPRLHCMAGILPNGWEEKEAWQVYKENLRFAAARLADHQITLLIEPINRYDMPGYLLSDLKHAYELICELDMPNVKIQYDFYHMQRIQGELIASYQTYKDAIGHIQIADNPGRHEPGTGEINYPNIFRFLKEIGYEGYIGLEYTPKESSDTSFKWLADAVDLARRGV